MTITHKIATFFALVACSAVLAAGPGDGLPPIPQPSVPPSPPPAPDSPIRLVKGQYYVIRKSEPQVIRQLPGSIGEVSFRVYNGKTVPFRLPAEMVIGWPADPADPEFVTFKDEFVYPLKAAKTGSVLLEIVSAVRPIDEKTKLQIPLREADFIRRTIDVDAGQGPIPPPSPKVDPVVPQPVPGPIVGLRVAIVYEAHPATKLTNARVDAINSTKVADYLDSHCVKDAAGRADWRRWPSNIDAKDGLKNETLVWQGIWKSAKPLLTKLPQVVIVRDTTIEAYPEVPADEAGLLNLLKQYGGP